MKVKLLPYGDDAFLPLSDELLERFGLKAGDHVEAIAAEDNALVVTLLRENE